jgi:hypothetical protein
MLPFAPMNRQALTASAIAVALLTANPHQGLAGSPATSSATTTTQPAPPKSAGADHFYTQGNSTLTTELAYVAGLGWDRTMPSVRIGGHHFVQDSLSIGLDVSAYGVSQDGEDAAMLGLAGVVRHHFARFDRATLFADVSFGSVEASARVPQEGTRFNFITRFGPGATFQLSQRTNLIIAARYWHLSNAQIEGARRNPSLNGAELSIGLMWRW